MRSFKKNIMDIYGDQGKEWLAKLPVLTAALAQQYHLSDLQPVTNMSFNYVATAYQNEKKVILKLGLNVIALAKEVSCLKAFSNHGACQVLARGDGMILMQRAMPGSTLKEYFPNKDTEAVTIISRCIQQLHSAATPDNHNFDTLNELLKILDADLDIPSEILAKARGLRDDLLATSDKHVLLHGDLHHENILKNGDDWLVIDPKGFIGDPVFEVCAFIHNPIPQLLEQANLVEIINKRINLCSSLLGFSQHRILDWLYVKSVLCWAWCLDDNMSVEYFKRFVSLLSEAAET